MTKKATVILIMILLALIVGGCGKSADSSGAGANEQKENDPVIKAAETILKLKADKQWAELYGYLHPDVQAAVTKDEFVKIRSGVLEHTKLKYDDFTVVKYAMLKEWHDTFDKSKTYTDVAEVSYTVRVETSKGVKDIGNTMHLVKDKDGKWKYLWFTR